MSLKKFVNTPDHWKAFLSHIEEEIEKTHKLMEVSTAPEEFYRLQGRVRAYRNLAKLRDSLNHG